MHPLSRQLTYEKQLIILVCDFYDMKHIPNQVGQIENHFPLYPINKYPLIDYILHQLLEQNYKNVVLVGYNIKKVLEYVSSTKYPHLMNISYISSDGMGNGMRSWYAQHHLGQIMKSLKEFDLTKSFLVLYANTFTNIKFSSLFKIHKKQKNLISMFLFERESNDPERYYYEIKEDTNALKGYKKMRRDKMDNCDTGFSSPAIFVCRSDACLAFDQFPDCRTILQFFDDMNSVGALDHYKFGCIFENDLVQILQNSNSGKKEQGNFISTPPISQYQTTVFYNREMTTLLDFISLNLDFKDNPYFEDFYSPTNISPESNFATLSLSHKWKIVISEDSYILDLGKYVNIEPHPRYGRSLW